MSARENGMNAARDAHSGIAREARLVIAREARLVIALDTQDSDAALHLADALAAGWGQESRDRLPWLKVGLELFVHAGPDMVRRLKDKGFHIFVDLKMYDIPNTVRGGILSAASAGADMITIHTQGGARMAQAAAEAAAEAGTASGHTPLIMGVTVLTSMAEGELPLSQAPLAELIPQLAEGAHQWGLHGIVCSGHEVAAIKQRCGRNFLCLTPGIRPASGTADDQRRIMTPAEAVRAGSDFLVVGRPITRAADPVAAARAISEEMQRTLS